MPLIHTKSRWQSTIAYINEMIDNWFFRRKFRRAMFFLVQIRRFINKKLKQQVFSSNSLRACYQNKKIRFLLPKKRKSIYLNSIIMYMYVCLGVTEWCKNLTLLATNLYKSNSPHVVKLWQSSTSGFWQSD